jgi:hypothetical protein
MYHFWYGSTVLYGWCDLTENIFKNFACVPSWIYLVTRAGLTESAGMGIDYCLLLFVCSFWVYIKGTVSPLWNWLKVVSLDRSWRRYVLGASYIKNFYLFLLFPTRFWSFLVLNTESIRSYLKGTLARDFRPSFFSIKSKLLAHDQAPKLILNINLNSPRYSNLKAIPRIIRIRGKKLFCHARAK